MFQKFFDRLADRLYGDIQRKIDGAQETSRLAAHYEGYAAGENDVAQRVLSRVRNALDTSKDARDEAEKPDRSIARIKLHIVACRDDLQMLEAEMQALLARGKDA